MYHVISGIIWVSFSKQTNYLESLSEQTEIKNQGRHVTDAKQEIQG